MIQRSVTVIACLLAVLGSDVARSEETSDVHNGTFLLAACNSWVRSVDQGENGDSWAEGYCIGFIDTLVYMQTLLTVAHNVDPSFCVPDGYSNEQGIRVLVKYLTNHPEKLHQPYVMLSMLALMEAFPCD